MHEATIGNHDQNFLNNSYLKLKQLSLSLMKDVLRFCDKTIDATTTEKIATETSLKSNTNIATTKLQKVQYFEIQTESYHSVYDFTIRWSSGKTEESSLL